MLQIDFYSENFDGISGRKLEKFLNKIKDFRTDFWLELKGDIGELDNFIKENTLAFYSVNSYGYLLGKFESMILPELEYNKPYDMSSSVDLMFISEVYVKPQYRGHLVANFMIRNAQFAGRAKNLPLILGCRKELVSYFKNFCFIPVENFKNENCAFMFWSFSPTDVERRFELLFKDSM